MDISQLNHPCWNKKKSKWSLNMEVWGPFRVTAYLLTSTASLRNLVHMQEPSSQRPTLHLQPPHQKHHPPALNQAPRPPQHHQPLQQLQVQHPLNPHCLIQAISHQFQIEQLIARPSWTDNSQTWVSIMKSQSNSSKEKSLPSEGPYWPPSLQERRPQYLSFSGKLHPLKASPVAQILWNKAAFSLIARSNFRDCFMSASLRELLAGPRLWSALLSKTKIQLLWITRCSHLHHLKTVSSNSWITNSMWNGIAIFLWQWSRSPNLILALLPAWPTCCQTIITLSNSTPEITVISK